MQPKRKITKCAMQEHVESADLHQGKSSPYVEFISRVQIWTRETDDFQNLMGNFLSKETSLVKFSWRCNLFSRIYEPNCGKMSYFTMLKNPSKNSWIWI